MPIHPCSAIKPVSTFLVSLFLATATTTPLSASFAEYRIATVDLSKLLNEAEGAKEGLENLEERRAKIQKEMKSKIDSLRPKIEKLKEKGEKASASEIAKLRQEEKDVARFEQDKKEELARELNNLKRETMKTAFDAIQSYAKENKIDLVLHKGGEGNERGPVIFGDKEYDITDEILDRID